jgi:hypothetical protein
MFKCHNCALALPFGALLKRANRALHDDYVMERLKDEQPRRSSPAPAVPAVQPFSFKFERPDLTPAVADCPEHKVYRFCIERSLPLAALKRLFLTDHARTWLKALVPIEKIGPDDAPKITDGVAYLIQPLRLQDGTWYGAQLRSIGKKDFYTFRWSHDTLKLFGLDAWTPGQLSYVVEGPIDSLFLPNSLAPCGADLLSGIRQAEDLGILPGSTPLVYVWDNEPRNPQIVRHIQTAIRLRERVVIWPRMYQHKDINDMVRRGVDVVSLLAKRTFTGYLADLEFHEWQKTS